MDLRRNFEEARKIGQEVNIEMIIKIVNIDVTKILYYAEQSY